MAAMLEGLRDSNSKVRLAALIGFAHVQRAYAPAVAYTRWTCAKPIRSATSTFHY
jgi:hypothetical protein